MMQNLFCIFDRLTRYSSGEKLLDPLSAFLKGPRASGAFVLASSLDPPWSLRVADGSALTVVAMVRGSAHVLPDGAARYRLEAGDVAIVSGARPYTLASADPPPMAPQLVFEGGDCCSAAFGDLIAGQLCLGVRSWGNAEQGETLMVSGTYEDAGAVGQALLEVLPRVVVARGSERRPTALDLLAEEVEKDQPGQAALLDRLLDLLLITVLRRYFEHADDDAPRWFRAQEDPAVWRGVKLLQEAPAAEWTVASLAKRCGLSRAAFARRFKHAVGESPMRFWTRWRLTLAADLLRDPELSVGEVAEEVGYESPFSFSAAFKRHFGVSPSRYGEEGPAGRRVAGSRL